MFSKSQTSNLANGILEDQLHKDEASATLAAVRIGHAIYSCLYNIDHDGHSFVTRTSDEEAERVSAWSRTLADQLAPAAPLLGLLAERRLEGRDEAIQFACDGGYPPIPSGAPGVVIDSHVRARRIAGRFLSTLKDRGLELSNDSWPRRVVELAKVKGESANAAFEVVIGLRRDLELLSAFYDCIADEYDNKRGAPLSPGPMLFARAILEWFDATERLPSGHRKKGKGNARSRPDLYGLMEELWGTPKPRGLSEDTYADVLNYMADEKARERFRYEHRIELAKRKATDNIS